MTDIGGNPSLKFKPWNSKTKTVKNLSEIINSHPPRVTSAGFRVGFLLTT